MSFFSISKKLQKINCKNDCSCLKMTIAIFIKKKKNASMLFAVLFEMKLIQRYDGFM